MAGSKERPLPQYHLHKPSGGARTYIDGREFRLGRHGTDESRERFNRLVSTWLVNGRRLPLEADGHDITIAEVIVEFMEHAQRRYQRHGKPTREYSNFKPPLRHLQRLYGSTPAAQFGPKAFSLVRDALLNQHKPPQPGATPLPELSRRYVNDCMKRIRRMFRWASEQDLIPASVSHGVNVVSGLRRGKGGRETEKVQCVPDAFVEAIKPYVSKQIWGLIELQLATGMRPGEAIALRGRDLNMSGSIWEICPTEHKTAHFGIDRMIQVGPRGQEVLSRFLKADLGAYLFSPRDAQEERFAKLRAHRQTRVQPSQLSRKKTRPSKAIGPHYTVDSYRQAIHRACDHADRAARGAPLSQRVKVTVGPQLLLFDADATIAPEDVSQDQRLVPRWGPNRLRHNFATRIRREMGLEVARAMLGHTSANTTLIYAEADRLKARKAAEMLG